MGLSSKRAGLHARASAANCVLALLWAACNVYDSDATRARFSNTQANSVRAQCEIDAAASEGCLETCNGQDDDNDGLVDEDAAGSCILPHAQAVCREGECLLARCTDGYRDCDQEVINGCEIARDDIAHCAQCQKACSIEHGQALCTLGRCELDTCEPGYADCDQDSRACEARLDSDQHCGACGARCTRLAHANAACAEGSCLIAECDKGYGDCDENPINGCEQKLNNLRHCGGCNVACDKQSCGGGICSKIDCSGEPGHADCDDDGRSCETDLTRDADHCGSCEHACRFAVELPHASAACSDGACRAQCDPDFDDCDGQFQNGCETSLVTDTDCGGCGSVCRMSHAQVHCVLGRCEFQACDDGYADCDADKKGCERSLADADSCGSCSVRCEFPHARARCSTDSDNGRACELERCDEGWEDCDGTLGNGCERDVRPVAQGGSGPCLPDASCESDSLGEHRYYFCSAQRSWDEAREACMRQRGGDLAELRDADTRSFLSPHLSTRVWIGHNDLEQEGLWIWAASNVPFWRGTAGGRALNGAYTRWARGEPNRSGNCGAFTDDAELDDLTCTMRLPFICEVGPDLCPEDPDKSHPGQCGCGERDTDANDDGLAECAD